MTITQSELTGGQLGDPDPLPPPSTVDQSRRWWRRPWVIPLWLLATAFILGFVPRYLSFEPSRSLVRLDEGFPWHFPLLVGHVICGTIALVAVCLQVWPWLRRRHPAFHRWSGRAFVFAGVLPSGLFAVLIVPFSFAPAGNAVNAILWLGTTAVGFRMARKRRYLEHRRWMIYSFAVTMQILWGRLLFLSLPLFPSDAHTQTLVIETASWIGFVINLALAQWWIERTADRAKAELAARG